MCLTFAAQGVRIFGMSINPAIDQLITEIRDDTTHGASELARQSLEVLRVAAMASRAITTGEFQAEMDEISRALMKVRPSMAPVYNAVNRLMASVNGSKMADVSSLRGETIAKVDNLVKSSVQAISLIASLAADKIADGDVILTHSYSSTVGMALKAAHEKHQFQIITTRSGAGRIGERMVWEVAFTGIPVTFIDDTAMGLYVSQASKVMVGADRICADGGLVNGIGTYLLALAAGRAGVPFLVLCETLKFDSRLKSTEV